MKEKKYNFIKNIEKLVDPSEVARISIMEDFSRNVPKRVITSMMKKASKKNKYMGFIVEPYSSFLCYEILDINLAKSLLPDGFELIKTKMFQDDSEKYYCVIGTFNVSTSAFIGSRLEVNIIAKNVRTNLTSWVIIDWESNVINFTHSQGLTSPTTKHFINTIDYNANLIVDIKGVGTKRLIFDANVIDSKRVKLDDKVWLDGNLSIIYGGKYNSSSEKPFSLKFEIGEVENGMLIKSENLNLVTNSFVSDLIGTKPVHLIYFPFAQHFLSDSPMYFSDVKSSEEMLSMKSSLDLNNYKPSTSKSFILLLKRSLLFSYIGLFILIMIIILICIK